ncbi:uncharacterized protein [Haliotis cracherodii]|uniref:uncharacterized protein n=1 Tax=Haliotis cracherodii TaxID=6455 RepID=UPI0039EBF7AE
MDISAAKTTHESLTWPPLKLPTEGSKQGQSVSITTHQYIGCSVSQYDLSNSSNIAVGHNGQNGCLSQESLCMRIKELRDGFIATHALSKAQELLKRHHHVAICGAPGDGKTTTALMLCEKYRKKKYEILFVENIEKLAVETIIKRQNHMIVVFDDIFGSVTFSANMDKLHNVFNTLNDALLSSTRDNETVAKKTTDEKIPRGQKILLIFTSRSYNWNEGSARLHQFKVNIFKPEAIVDLTRSFLTTEEKKAMIQSFSSRSRMCEASSKDMQTITELQDSIFGYPLICKLYYTNPVFQMHSRIDFFQNPVTYLRGDLDTIVREGSSRSAALVLLVLCGGKLDLVAFKLGIDMKYTDLLQVVKEEISLCTRTGIAKEICNFTGTYCTVENHVASFFHPSIHDAAACALGNLNDVLLLKHCSLQFLYERVRLSRDSRQQTTHTDDVTNMIYITSSLHPLVISRLVEGVREGCFRWTVGHPVFRSAQIASSFLTQIMADLPGVVHRKDRNSGECFLYWVSLSTNHSLFERSVSLMSKDGNISHSALTDFYDSITGSIQNGYLKHLQHITAVLKQHGKYDVNWRTKRGRTMLMAAAETGQLDVFNYLLKEGADVSLRDWHGHNCLHISCKYGSHDIVRVVIEQFQQMIEVPDKMQNTPAMMSAKSGQCEILKCLVSHKADLTVTNYCNCNCLHIACANGHVSVVKYLISFPQTDMNMKGGFLTTTPVMMAAEGGHYAVYDLLVSEGADLSHTDDYNRDCLMLACGGGNLPIVKHLLSLNTSDINRKGHNGQTSVMLAAAGGQSSVYNLLVSKGADLSLIDNDNRDCLMLACEGGDISIVKHLLSLKTVDVNRRGGWQETTPVLMAAEWGHSEVFNLLVSRGADLSRVDRYNRNCLMLACKGGNLSIAKHLLSLNTFDINKRGGCSDQTPVMVSIEEEHYDVYHLLASEGADVSLADKFSTDCLMAASMQGNISTVKHLLSLNIFDINRRGGWRQHTAVMMAAGGGHLDVYKLFVSQGADLSLSDVHNRDCLMLACMGCSLAIVQDILSLGTFDINRRGGCSDQTPVMVAAEEGRYDIYNLLVSAGADLSITDGSNRDCVIWACKGGNPSIVKHLLSLNTFGRGEDGCDEYISCAKGHKDIIDLLKLYSVKVCTAQYQIEDE